MAVDGMELVGSAFGALDGVRCSIRRCVPGKQVWMSSLAIWCD